MKKECRNPETCGYSRVVKPYKKHKGAVYCVRDMYDEPGQIQLKKCDFADMRKK